ncbi:MAG: blaR0 [Verrucomicrobiales bacterium]|nr:blaR0 [Verrucomicrobiales bacterium]
MKYLPYTVMGCLVVALGWLGWNQNQIAHELARIKARPPATVPIAKQDFSTIAIEELRNRFERTRIDLNAALHGISQTSTRLDGLQKTVETLNRQMQGMIAARQTNTLATTIPPKDIKPMLIEVARRPAELVQTKPKPKKNLVRRRWGPEQATGAPDTMEAGDNASAWAPRTPHSGLQWLQLEFEKAVDLEEVRVRETFNPGAVCKITAIDGNGKEVKIWEGVELPTAAPAEMSFPAACRTQTDRVKIYLDTNRVAGWNEIDAVELVARDGTRQWAIDATASSSYADR